MAVYGPECHPQNIIWTEASGARLRERGTLSVNSFS
jgi:hypothetical protein